MKIKFKRVCLVNPINGDRMDFDTEFLYTLSDKAILDFLYEPLKNVWINGNLYKDFYGCLFKYEVYKVVRRV